MQPEPEYPRVAALPERCRRRDEAGARTSRMTGSIGADRSGAIEELLARPPLTVALIPRVCHFPR
jgi:hypothetical protein